MAGSWVRVLRDVRAELHRNSEQGCGARSVGERCCSAIGQVCRGSGVALGLDAEPG